jgi:hypothetical protein
MVSEFDLFLDFFFLFSLLLYDFFFLFKLGLSSTYLNNFKGIFVMVLKNYWILKYI